MGTRTQISRADLLACLDVHGRETLTNFAEVLGYVRKVSLPEPPPKIRQAVTPDPFHLDVTPRPVVEDVIPPAPFYRVVSQRDLTPDEVVREEPDWYRQAEPYRQPLRPDTERLPPRQLPLMRWSRLWPFLKAALGAVQVTSALDIPRLVDGLARGHTLRHLPRRHVRTWARECHVLLDFAEPLRPFHADMNDLHRRLRRLRGMQGLTLISFPEGNPHDRGWVYQGQKWRPIDRYRTPGPGTPVLVLSDLGSLSASETRRRQWQALGQRLHQGGCRPVALMPCPPRRWDRALTRLFFPVSWDRAIRPPRRLTARWRQAARPQAAPTAATERLLSLLAPAIRVEPALLRAVRYLLPAQEADVGTEAAAWNHSDVHTTALAFYYDRNMITLYRDAFAGADETLRRQVASLIVAHHAHLPPSIGYEEQLLLADLDSLTDASTAQTFMARLVKTVRTQSSEFADASSAWVDRMAERQHPSMWQRDALAAAWVAVRQRRGEALLDPPQGIDLARVSWLLASAADASLYTLRQRGQTLWLEPVDHRVSIVEWDVRGSLLGHVRMSAPYLQWGQLGDGEMHLHEQVLPIEGAIPLPTQTGLQLRTDHQELLIDTITRPDWAEVISRNEQGLFVGWQEGTQRAYWINPGRYPVYGRTGRQLGQLPIANGYWCREAEALAQLRDGFRPPLWAEDYGLDGEGLYADFRIHGIRQRMRWIVPGEFMMGSPEGEEGRYDDEAQHQVILSQGFWLADSACTQALWQVVMGNNPSRFKGEDRPVESVSWDDVQDFLIRLNEAAPDPGFRLPTEAEWEYACRAGTTTAFWFGDEITPEQVNYNGHYPYAGGKEGLYREETVPVKALPRNGWGLYEMHGNVWEWCQDGFGDYPARPVIDPTGSTGGEDRVLRGGSWVDGGQYVRSAYRSRYGPSSRNDFSGFRFARGQVSRQDVAEE